MIVSSLRTTMRVFDCRYSSTVTEYQGERGASQKATSPV